MFPLSRQERLALTVIAAVFLVGSLAEFVFKKYPAVRGAVLLLETDGWQPRVRVNEAQAGELVTVPHIGPVTAGEILRVRLERGCFSQGRELLAVPGIGPKRLRMMTPYLDFGGCPSS